MRITWSVFGVEVMTINLELPESSQLDRVSGVDKGVKVASRWWTRKMTK